MPTSADEISDILSSMDGELLNSESCEKINISVEDVSKALGKLNSNKRDGTKGTFSNHFINCSHKMKVYITIMLNSMFTHGFTPDDLLESVITSIPKDLKGNLCVDDNYRSLLFVHHCVKSLT